ncbi:hypothetical protein MM817_01609 [Acidibacillus sp. S0AB]|uniref:Thioredoxin-like fold domain-containing protein n=1 Tax=Sulfoacidibacillus ferrooxidans TaxID=2005001 RepID=A0A9X1V8X8_9BACL|nr:hypothetical protein [Sulfoacidibacillus ferrooxidans]
MTSIPAFRIGERIIEGFKPMEILEALASQDK